MPACAVINRLSAHKVKTVRIRNLRLLTAATILATLALIAAIWLLEVKPGGG
jgi:hypothetical protein